MNRKIAISLYLLVFSFAVYSFFQFPGFQGYEDETYMRIVKNLETGELKAARAGYVQTVLETPFVLKGKIMGDMLGVSSDKTAQLYALFYNPFITAVSVTVMFLIFNLFVSRKRAFFLSLIYAFGTMIFPYAAIGMEPTAVLFVLLATYFLFQFRKGQENKHLVLSGFFYFLLFFSKAYYFVTLPAFVGYLYPIQVTSYKLQVTKKFLISCLLFLLPLIIIFPIYLLANKYNFGNYLGGQYNLANELTGGENIIFGIYGLLLSFGKSIFIYSPVLALSVVFFRRFYKQFKNEALFVILYSLFMILFVARIHWWSDETWGPRYLLSLSAIGLLPLVATSRKMKSALVYFIIVASFLFQFLGVLVRYDVFPYSFYEIYEKTSYNVLASQEYQYIPQFAPYLVNYQVLENRVLDTDDPLKYKIIYTPPMEETAKEKGKEVAKEITIDNARYKNHALNFWWNNVLAVSPKTILFFYLLAFIGLALWGRNVLKFKKEQ